jgi:hypothetical protein
LQSFKLALSFYQITQSPIGIHSTQLHLANVLFKQGHTDDATKMYSQAQQGIRRLKLEFLYSMLEHYEHTFRR